jgi:hypothetical protein
MAEDSFLNSPASRVRRLISSFCRSGVLEHRSRLRCPLGRTRIASPSGMLAPTYPASFWAPVRYLLTVRSSCRSASSGPRLEDRPPMVKDCGPGDCEGQELEGVFIGRGNSTAARAPREPASRPGLSPRCKSLFGSWHCRRSSRRHFDGFAIIRATVHRERLCTLVRHDTSRPAPLLSYPSSGGDDRDFDANRLPDDCISPSLRLCSPIRSNIFLQ